MVAAPTAVSLFSGCGGSDAGLVEAGYKVVFANDTDAYARDVYLANLPRTRYRSAKVEEIESFPSGDLLVGCYPCQGFSEGGARNPKRRVNYLYRQFDRALRQIRPKAFIVENVPGLMRSNFRHLLKNQLVRFRLAGYRVRYERLNAAAFGVPQDRWRLFLVGIRSDIDAQYRFPDPTHGPEASQPFKTIREALRDFPEWPEGEYWSEPFHWYYMSRNRRREWDELSKTVTSRARHTPLHPLSPPLRKVKADHWEWTHDGRRRRFSFREAAVLQGFPADFAFPDSGNLRAKYRVIGNAVPPPLFRAVAEAIPDIW